MEQAPASPFSTAFNKMRSLVALLFILVAGPLLAVTHFHFYCFGQTNMAGRQGDVEDKVAVPRVLMLNKANEWVSAVDPICLIKSSTASVALASRWLRQPKT